MRSEKKAGNSERVSPVPPAKSRQKKMWPWIMVVGTAVVAAAAGFFFWTGEGDHTADGKSVFFPDQMTFSVPEKKELRLDDFLIILAANPVHTGMSFSLVIRYRGSEWSAMSDHEKIWFRAMIYDTLVQKVHEQEKPPSVERLVFWADRAIKEIYPNRGFDELIVDNTFML